MRFASTTPNPLPSLTSIEYLDNAFPYLSSPHALVLINRALPPIMELLTTDPLPSSKDHLDSSSSSLTNPCRVPELSKAQISAGQNRFKRRIYLQYSRKSAYKSNLHAHVSKFIIGNDISREFCVHPWRNTVGLITLKILEIYEAFFSTLTLEVKKIHYFGKK